MNRRIYSATCGFLLLSLSHCSDRETTPIDRFPPKPDGPHLYYNSSGIGDVRRIANMNMGRAKELTDIEIAMVFLGALPPSQTIEQYAVGLLEEWRVGADHGGRGVLFLFVEDMGEMKIEVSYELEPIFTDSFCKSFQDTIKTYFASEHLGDVVSNSINNMVRHYQGKPVETIDFAPLRSSAKENNFLSGGGGIVERNFVFDKDAKLAAISDLDPEVLSRYKASEEIHESISNYLDSLEAGVGHPHLDVLTPGSRYMRIEYPKTTDFQRREYRNYSKAMPYRILQKGGLAAVRFKDDRAIPLLFVVGSDKKWRVDMPKSWGLVTGSNDLSRYPINSQIRYHPWEYAFPDQLPSKGRIDVSFFVPIGEDPQVVIQQLSQKIESDPLNPRLRLQLAKVLFWECYLILAAIKESEKAVELDPDFSEAYWFAINARYRAPALEGIQSHYQALIGLHPNDASIKREHQWFIETTGK